MKTNVISFRKLQKKAADIWSLFVARKINVVALVGVLLFVLIAVFAEQVSPYDPNATSFFERLQAPSAAHILGTDTFGRDVFSRLVFGARVSLLVGTLSVLIAAAIGTVLGMCCAYFHGWFDNVVMRICEAFRAIPQVIMATVLIAILGNSMREMTLIMALTAVPTYIRMMRASVLSTMSNEYIMVEKLQGQRSIEIMFRHLLPNSVSPIIVLMTQSVGFTIMAESGLSFLGLGISIPTASWGTMLNDAKDYLMMQPIYAIAPGVAITLLVLCLNLLGDGIRDIMDPRLRGTLKGR